ncbi:MAG: AMP-binding protein [Ilumatobacteraceae bacterium]
MTTSGGARSAGRPQLAVGDWLAAGARKYGSARFLVAADGTESSFAETHDRVNRLARALLDRELGVGHRVAILATDSVPHVEVVLACFTSGAVFCDLNFRMKGPEIRRVLEAAGCDAIVVEARYLELLDGALPSDRGIEIITLDGSAPGHASIEQLISAQPSCAEIPAQSIGEDVVSIAFTSGTTGTPKGVIQSERMFRNIIYSGIREMRMQEGAFRYAGAPLFHISGIGSVFYSLASGSAILILPQFEAPTVLHWMQHGGLTDCTLIPTMISALLELPDVAAVPYDRLRSILYGGAPMTPALLRRTIEVFGCELYNGFGAGTEAGGQTMLYPEDHDAALAGREHLLGSIGRPVMGVDLRLCDDEMNDVPRGTVGEIVTRSDTVMHGYLDQPELTARSIVDGWFRAGDMAYMDEDGYLYLATRKADMIIRGGENVYPVEIEAVLAEHPAVAEVAVVGLPDDHWGEIVGAALSLHPGAQVDTQELREFCRARLASYKVPAVFTVFPSLPRAGTGKLDKRSLTASMEAASVARTGEASR